MTTDTEQRTDNGTRDRIAVLDAWMRKHIGRQWVAILILFALVVLEGIATAYVLNDQSGNRYDALVSRCRATNDQNQGILRFLEERAPRALPSARPYFPVEPDCDRYARDLGASP